MVIVPVGDENFVDWFARKRTGDELPPDVPRNLVIDAAIDNEPPLVFLENIDVDVEWFIRQWQSSPANPRSKVCNLTRCRFNTCEIQIDDLQRPPLTFFPFIQPASCVTLVSVKRLVESHDHFDPIGLASNAGWKFEWQGRFAVMHGAEAGSPARITGIRAMVRLLSRRGRYPRGLPHQLRKDRAGTSGHIVRRRHGGEMIQTYANK